MSVSPVAPPVPQRPDLSVSIPETERINSVQKYIESFDYNYSGKPFLEMKKNRGAAHIQSCTLQIIKAALPIQCVEAVFLGCFLTAEMTTVDRIPLSFKSYFRGNVHRHIVLAVRYADKWGALGISRRENLMNKPLVFDSLADLVMEYKKSYEECFHKLLTVYVGLPMPREFTSDFPVTKWRAIKVRVFSNTEAVAAAKINEYCTKMHAWAEFYEGSGCLPEEAGSSNNSSKNSSNNRETGDPAQCNI